MPDPNVFDEVGIDQKLGEQIPLDLHFRNEAGETVFAAGGAAGTLPWIGDGHPACDPIAMLIPAYRAIEGVARRRGYDPDKPPHLSKVTRTL